MQSLCGNLSAMIGVPTTETAAASVRDRPRQRSRQIMKATHLLLACVLGLGLAACDRHNNPLRNVTGHERGARHEGGGGRGGLRRACSADLEQYCAADQTGRDRRQCLESHQDKLSADCKAALEARKNRRKGGGTGESDSD